MPSSNKTSHLWLNKWTGEDKPKKDDFNADNQKVDEACRGLTQDVETLKAAQSGFATTQSVTNVSSSVSSLSSTITAHTGNTAMHCTAAEKTAWAKSTDLVVGSYTGNGAAMQRITLGYQPQFGIIFMVDESTIRVIWSGEQLHAYTGFLSKLGASIGITVNPDGFTVQQIGATLDGFGVNLNTSGVKYVYFIWK